MPQSNIDSTLMTLGFTEHDGVLQAPADSVVMLAPIGAFYELRISLGDGNAVLCVVSKAAIKVSREGKPAA